MVFFVRQESVPRTVDAAEKKADAEMPQSTHGLPITR